MDSAVDRWFGLLGVGAEQLVPEDEDGPVVLVDVDGILGVVDPVGRRGDQQRFQWPECADEPGVHPELVDRPQPPGDQEGQRWNAEDGQRQETQPGEPGLEAALAQGGGEVVFLALVMGAVGAPGQVDPVAPPVEPVVHHLETDEGGRPCLPGPFGQLEEVADLIQPQVEVACDQFEADVHGLLEHPAAEGGDGVVEAVDLPIQQPGRTGLDEDGEEEDRNGEGNVIRHGGTFGLGDRRRATPAQRSRVNFVRLCRFWPAGGWITSGLPGPGR
jgi:hypothetical protein